MNAYRRHHGEGKHDERDVTPPAMPGARLVVIESEFVLGGFKAVLDRPTMTLYFRKLFEVVPCGAQVVKKARPPPAIYDG